MQPNQVRPAQARRASAAGIFPLAGILALLQIPLLLIVALVYNRQDYRDQAVREVGRMWGGEQTVGGPMLVIPYQATIWNDREKRRETVTRYARLLPRTLVVKAKMESQLTTIVVWFTQAFCGAECPRHQPEGIGGC